MERMPPMCINLPSIQRAGVAAALAATLLLHGPAAQAGEVVTTNCLHGFSDASRFGASQNYTSEYGSDYGNSHGFSRTDSDSRRGFRGGFRRAGSHGGFIGGNGNGNGHGIAGGSGSRAGHSSGYAGGNSNQYGGGSNSGDSSDSCVEIRRELTNPYVIRVQAPQSPEELAAAIAPSSRLRDDPLEDAQEVLLRARPDDAVEIALVAARASHELGQQRLACGRQRQPIGALVGAGAGAADQ